MALIYKITFKQTNKVYIGQTCRTLAARYAEHVYDALNASKHAVHRAMRKYGIENCNIELIEETNEPNERERHWIKVYDSYKNGYNETLGGDGHPIHDYDEIVEVYNKTKNIEKTALALKVSLWTVCAALCANNITPSQFKQPVSQIKNGKTLNVFESIRDAARFLISKHELQTTENNVAKLISNSCKTGEEYCGFNWGKNEPSKPQSIVSHRQVKMKDNNGNVICDFQSAAEAATAINGDLSAITKCCRGVQKTHKNFMWEYGDEQLKRPILQIKPENRKIVKEFNSMADIRDIVAFDIRHIDGCLKRKRLTANNYCWCYADEYDLFLSWVEKYKNRLSGIYEYDAKTKLLIKKWPSMISIVNELQLSSNAHITDCCQGKRKTAYGSIWRYACDCPEYA